MVGITLILGFLSLLVGLLLDPFWLVMGSPAILTLLVYVGVRCIVWLRWSRSPTYQSQVEDSQSEELRTLPDGRVAQDDAFLDRE